MKASAHQAKPEHLAAWIRGHWHIENQIRWVRDVTYDEDRARILAQAIARHGRNAGSAGRRGRLTVTLFTGLARSARQVQRSMRGGTPQESRT